MNTEERFSEQKKLVEDIGVYFDNQGFQPIAGRIIGFLMVMDKERYSFDEIIENLQISKGSASTILRILQLRGEIEYITIPGDRKKYYQIKYKTPDHLVHEFYNKVMLYKNIICKTLNLKADDESRNSKMFQEKLEMIAILEEQFEEFKKEIL